MSAFWLTVYILVWPVISIGVLGLLLISLARDWRAAKRSGSKLV